MSEIRSKAWLFALSLMLVVALAAKHYIERPPPAAPGHVQDQSITPNYSEVSPTLYIGGRVPAPPPLTNAVLNLCHDPDLYTAPIHEVQPIVDGPPAPSIDWLQQQVLFIDRMQKENRRTYVHCNAGMSRSAMVTTAYLMYKNTWTRDKALAFLKERRPIIRPNAYFMELLLAWEAKLKIPASAPAMAP
jgi:hypothetical protein